MPGYPARSLVVHRMAKSLTPAANMNTLLLSDPICKEAIAMVFSGRDGVGREGVGGGIFNDRGTIMAGSDGALFGITETDRDGGTTGVVLETIVGAGTGVGDAAVGVAGAGWTVCSLVAAAGPFPLAFEARPLPTRVFCRGTSLKRITTRKTFVSGMSLRTLQVDAAPEAKVS